MRAREASRGSVESRHPQSPPRPPARWRQRYPLSAKLFAEGIGMRRIGEAESDVVLLVVMPPAASPRFDAAFAVEGQYVVGLGSEAARRKRQLHDVGIVPFNHAGGDLAFAPAHLWIGSRFVSLLHHEPLALLIVQLERRNGSSLGCLVVRRLDNAKVLGFGALSQDRDAPRAQLGGRTSL
jgi:hypothetical protein